MGTSYGDFIKYPRTPHLFGSKGTADDKHLDEAESQRIISDHSLIVEEKSTARTSAFTSQMLVKWCCNAEDTSLTEGMHPQYDPVQTMGRSKAKRAGAAP